MLLIVAYYFVVTVTLTLTSVLFKSCAEHISYTIRHRNPKIDLRLHIHTGQCKSTGGCYNELVVAYFGTGGGVKWRKR